MPEFYPFDGKSTAVDAYFGAAFSFDPANPTKYTEALSYFLGTIVREFDVSPALDSSKFPVAWPDQEKTATAMAEDIEDGILASNLPAIIGSMLPAVISPLLSFGCYFLVGEGSPYKWIGETVLDNVIRFILNIALEEYKKAFADDNPTLEFDSAALEKRLEEINTTLKAAVGQEGVIEIDDVRIWAKSLVFDEVGE